MSEIVLQVNGANYGGWTGVSVSRSIETVAGAFDLTCTENVGGDAAQWPLRPNQKCKILVNGQTVIDGYIDKVSIDVSDSAHGIAVSGRDKTGDLVDCAAVHSPAQWRNIKLLDLVKILVAPFGLEVILETVADTPLAVFKLEPAETAFAAIERACKLRGVLPVQARGALVLTHVGTERTATPLVYGGNIKSATADFDFSDRFSTYTVSGQRAGNDTDNGKAVAHVKEQVADTGITRYRPFVKQADGQATAAVARRQAEWEKQVREARSTTLSCTVAGWTQQNGQVWDINLLAAVEAAILGVTGDLLISAVEYSYDDSGEITKMELKRPDAYLPDPEDVKKAEGKPEKAVKAKASGKAKAESKTKTKPKGGKAAKRGTGKNSAAGGWDGGGWSCRKMPMAVIPWGIGKND